MPDPPSLRDLKARITADVKRQGYSLISYDELRSAWPKAFATAAQFAAIGMMANEEDWQFEFVSFGVLFKAAAKA
jgi:hypothetical protein